MHITKLAYIGIEEDQINKVLEIVSESESCTMETVENEIYISVCGDLFTMLANKGIITFADAEELAKEKVEELKLYY